MNGNSIKAFYQVDYNDFVQQLTERIKNEIEGKGKEYILGVDEDEFKKYLISNYTIDLLGIDFDNEQIDKPIVKKEMVKGFSIYERQYEKEVYHFTIRYSFKGSSIIFKIRPSHFVMTTEIIYVTDNPKTVSFSFKLYNQDANEFNRIKNEKSRNAFANLDNANNEALAWNSRLSELVNLYFNATKSKYESENNFYVAINLKVNQVTPSVFSAPTVVKKIIPQPVVAKNKEFSSEPMMSKEIYDDILKVIYDSGKNMEKKPALYKDKDEEGLRDQFLFVLESRYDGTTATGETFNRGGKTDIILKYAKDGTNLFIAECKIWHGSSEFLKAISQLFDRYLTWRDSKTALIIFVKSKDITMIINTIKTDVKGHEYYASENGSRGDSSLSYIFHMPQDREKKVYFEIILFHYDK